MTSRAVASPSLALMKYWGKAPGGINLPATPSLAVTLEGLTTETRVQPGETDEVVLDGKPQAPEKFQRFFTTLREVTGSPMRFHVTSQNNFATAAGLASSSSGFAALAGACVALTEAKLTLEQLSSLARVGSGSASRSIYGGFTVFPANSPIATPLADEHFWPEFRVVLVTVTDKAKDHSSRDAMEHTRLTSPYFEPWVQDAAAQFPKAVDALKNRDLDTLGPLIRQSYLRMFASMFAASPPVLYWLPESLGLIRMAEALRTQGLSVWETMDAGPQVKLFCTFRDLPALETALQAQFPTLSYKVARPGPGLQVQVSD